MSSMPPSPLPSPSPSEEQESILSKNGTDEMHQFWKHRLKELMDEYNGLEDTEERLLSMLEQVRQQEECLVQALNDPVFAVSGALPLARNNKNNKNSVDRYQDGTVTTTATVTSTANQPSSSSLLSPSTIRTRTIDKDSQQTQMVTHTAQNLPSQAKQKPPPAPEERTHPSKSKPKPTIETPSARSAKRHKRGSIQPSTAADGPNANPNRHQDHNYLESNRLAQRREQKVLARQRLEQALFDDDDDDDDDSSSSSS